MNLLRCHILGFGKLAGLALSFGPGMNVIFAANEGGKSTLQRFLLALIYGQLRPDIKVQRRLDAWVEHYKPWRVPDYGGTLWCLLANGRELELHRTFGRDESKFEIRTSSGEDISRQYEAQRNGELLFAATHLGLSKEVFESAAVIRETETAELPNRDSLRDRIANLAQTGDEKLSVRLSLIKLEEALDAIGSERAPTRPYKQALDRLQELQQESRDLEARRVQCQAWIRERQDLTDQIERLESDLLAARRAVLDARWREAHLRVQTLLELDAEVRNIEGEIQSLGADPEFPIRRLDELNRLMGDRDSADQRLEELRAQLKDVQSRNGQCEADLRGLAPYGSLIASAEPEKITEWFVHYLSLSRQRDEVQRSVNGLRNEAAVIEQRLASLSASLQNPAIDWERKARQAGEEERAASQKEMALAEEVAQRKAEHARILGRAKQQGMRAALFFLAVLATAAAGFTGIIGGQVAFLVTIVLAAVCAALASAVSRTRSAAKQVQRTIETAEASLHGFREKAQAINGELRRAMSESGYASIDEFLAAAKQAGADRQRLADTGPHLQESEHRLERIRAEADGVFSQLRECLAKVGLSCAPGNLKTPVDIVRTNMRRHADLLAAQRRIAQQIETLRADEEKVAARSSQIVSSIRAILDEGKVGSPEAFQKGCADCRKLLELRARLESRRREFARLCGNSTLEQWQARLEELQKTRSTSGGEVENGPPRKLPYLPYLPTVEETEQEERRCTDLLAAKREEYARVVERVKQAFQNFRSPAEIEEDLSGAERDADRLSLNRTALSLALDEIRNLARLQQEVCAPQLNRATEDRFLRICTGRYQEVKIDPDFRIQVREKDTAELRAAESLSRGTQDQLYLAVRFGVLDLLESPQEPCPCFLDEPFAAYDTERIRAAFDILAQEANRRQLVLFTCREDVRDLAVRHGGHLTSL